MIHALSTPVFLWTLLMLVLVVAFMLHAVHAFLRDVAHRSVHPLDVAHDDELFYAPASRRAAPDDETGVDAFEQ